MGWLEHGYRSLAATLRSLASSTAMARQAAQLPPQAVLTVS